MTTDLGVLLPLRMETRFKNGDLWLRIIPDEPWFVRDDPRVTPGELDALRRFAAAPPDPSPGVPAAWRDLAAQVGAPRAVYLYRTFVTAAADGTLTVRTPAPAEQRTGPALPRITGFPTELAVWAADATGLHQVLTLAVNRSRLLADFADPTVPGDKRWWEDWQEAVSAGVAGIIPAASLTAPVDALYVTGLGDGDPAAQFAALAADGRLGLLEPGLPTNSVDGAAAAALATDAATWWSVLHGSPADSDLDVSKALTGDPARLGNLPGGQAHRAPAAALVTALWPALWGFTASQVFDVARGAAPASWASAALFPEGPYPSVRVGPQPYGLLPTTAWTRWQPDDGDPGLEVPLIKALLVLRAQHAAAAVARGTAAGKDTDALLDLIADTPSSGGFRYRQAWPLELWWLGMISSGLTANWPNFARAWTIRYPLADQLALSPLRRYGARGASRAVGIPLVLPAGATDADLPGLLTALADTALATPAAFASTASVEATVLQGKGSSLLLRLAVRSLQLLIGDVARERAGALSFDPEPFVRNTGQPARLQQLITTVTPPGPGVPTTELSAQLSDVAGALRALAAVPVPDLERMLRATIDTSSHRIDPWLTAIPLRRLDTLQGAGSLRRMLGAYGWVDAPAPGHPGPTAAGLLHTPSASSALAAAVLRDRAISDPSPRWAMNITSRGARAADRIAAEVRNGAHLNEAMGREVERIVGRAADIQALRTAFPVRTEHAGRRVCDGMKVLAATQLPVTLDSGEQAAMDELRAALDVYGDLLVADAVHLLVEGRADTAGQVMDAAAGLSQPPELSLLRTARDGRGISSSVVIALPYLPAAALPADASERALVSPAATLDQSAAAQLAAYAGPAAEWDFTIGPAGQAVTLADLGLTPADALSLPLSTVERLAVQFAGAAAVEVTGGSGSDRYERAAELAGLIGRNPATRRALSETRTADPPGDPVDPELVTRYAAVRDIAVALAGELQAQVALLGANDLGSADQQALGRLLSACACWGIAPNPPGPPGPGQVAATARLALPQIEARLAAAPDQAAAAQLSRAAFLDAAVALASPTGQLAITATTPARQSRPSRPPPDSTTPG